MTAGEIAMAIFHFTAPIIAWEIANWILWHLVNYGKLCKEDRRRELLKP